MLSQVWGGGGSPGPELRDQWGQHPMCRWQQEGLTHVGHALPSGAMASRNVLFEERLRQILKIAEF